ncbi:hypothetical protein L2E82_20757 [Cichorium intybus]|uniref:Uncharacterized protein n=1 Tax=Cichorium intybus TaxID=13427 RepID=A0ACB9DV22_CICIN|nr:hypothetical protein L2E82_20757 [Cichorium intybus]
MEVVVLWCDCWLMAVVAFRERQRTKNVISAWATRTCIIYPHTSTYLQNHPLPSTYLALGGPRASILTDHVATVANQFLSELHKEAPARSCLVVLIVIKVI